MLVGVSEKELGEGVGADTIAQELVESGIQIEATNDADIFFELDKMYRNAVDQLKTKSKEKTFNRWFCRRNITIETNNCKRITKCVG